MSDGWRCPCCGSAHGPHVDTCPVGASSARVQSAPRLSEELVEKLRKPYEGYQPFAEGLRR